MSEVWRSIPSFPHYAASSEGRIRRVAPVVGGGGSRRPSGTILRSRPLPTGHRQVTLSVGNVRHDCLVHRLVTEAFHGPAPADKPFACHRNDVSDHNRPENLYWGDRASNAADAIANGRVANGERVSSAKLTAADVSAIRRRAAAGERQRDLARAFGVHQGNVSQIVNRLTWRHVA